MNLLNISTIAIVALSSLLSSTDAALRKPRGIVKDSDQLSHKRNKDDARRLKTRMANTVKRITNEDLDDNGGSDYLTAFLESDECESFMDGIGQATGELFEFDDESIIEYACNSIQMQELIRTGDKVEEHVAHHEKGTLTCQVAFEMKLLEQKSRMSVAMSDSGSCREQLGKELEVVHEARRSLKEMGGHGRELNIALVFFLGFVVVIYVVFMAIIQMHQWGWF